MSSAARYAVVADEFTVAAMLRKDTSNLMAVCVVDGDTAECHILEDGNGLEQLIDGMPVTPSGYSPKAAFPSFAAETEALALISDALSGDGVGSEAASFPAGFVPASARMEGGFWTRLTAYGVDIKISLSLASALGWLEGDRVCLGSSPDSRLLAVTRGAGGAVLSRSMDEPSVLSLDHDLSGLPLLITPHETGWRASEYQVTSGCLVFVAVADELPPSETNKDEWTGIRTDDESPAPRQRFVSRMMYPTVRVGLWGLFTAAGFIIGRFWV